MDRLTAALSAVQTEKLKLEFEFEKVCERDAASRRERNASADVAMQLRTVMQRLDAALSERSVVSTANFELQKEVEVMKSQMQQKRRDVMEMEVKLQDSRRQETSWRERFVKLETRMSAERQQLDQKMNEWFRKVFLHWFIFWILISVHRRKRRRGPSVE